VSEGEHIQHTDERKLNTKQKEDSINILNKKLVIRWGRRTLRHEQRHRCILYHPNV